MDPVILFAIIGIILLSIFVLLSGKGVDGRNIKKKKIYQSLNEVKNSLNSGERNNRDAVIRLDSLLSKSLQLRFSNNNSCGENLKKARSLFTKEEYNLLWTYHKLRNKVVHEDIEVESDDADKAFKVFKNSIYKIVG